MIFEKIPISRDTKLYSAWPDVTLTGDGRLLCVFTECRHHGDRASSRIMICESRDFGRSWSEKRPFPGFATDEKHYCNCARISRLADNRLCLVTDRIPAAGESNGGDAHSEILLSFSGDNGNNWSIPAVTPIHGIVPDKLKVLDNGRWLLATHFRFRNKLTVFLHYSDDEGKHWSKRIQVAHSSKLNLCEASLLPMGNGCIAAFMRENSQQGWDCQKVLSFDNGEHWGEITNFPLPGCHRPVAGFLRDGRVMITYRFAHGAGGFGQFTQNFFCAFTDRESVLTTDRNEGRCRIVPVDYDRSRVSDTGYSGWMELSDGTVFIVNYIVDDAVNRGQIRGYLFNPQDIFC